MSLFLLDVNVLLALVDPRHMDHERAHEWFRTSGMHGWATCPITENGFIRIASNPKYPNSPGNALLTREILTRFCKHAHHAFWPDSETLRDDRLFSLDGTVSASHLTDVYLLGLAAHKRGKLATFDRHIPVSTVRGGTAALELIV